MFVAQYLSIVEVESRLSWDWFINHVRDDLELGTGCGLTVLSDQQNGLVQFIIELLPLAEHRCCARHVYANLRKQHSVAGLKSLFWQTVKVGTTEEFEGVMAEIHMVNKVASNYLFDHKQHL